MTTIPDLDADASLDMPRLRQLLTEQTVFDRPDPWVEFATRTIPVPDYVYRRRRLAVLIVVALVVLVLVAIREGVIVNEEPPTSSPDILQVQQPCEEDEPCWDCNTMGNRICGPEGTP